MGKHIEPPAIAPEIHIYRSVLSDRSETFDVKFFDFEELLYAVTEKDAYELAEKIRAAIKAHTCCGDVRVVDPDGMDVREPRK